MDMTAIYASIIVVLIIGSAFFSMSETAFTSVNQIRLKKMSADGNSRATKALKVMEDYDKFITTILIGNNIVNIASTSIATMVFSALLGAETGALASTVVMTLVILTFGEIVPKSYAKKSPEKVCIALCSIIWAITIILTPLSMLFRGITNMIGKIVKGDNANTLTEDELGIVIDEYESDGIIESAECDLVKSALEFDDRSLSEVYVPRMKIVAAPKEVTKEELGEMFTETEFSRIPIYEGTIDNIVGMIRAMDFFTHERKGKEFSLESLIIPLAYYPENMTLAKVFADMQKRRTHLAVVLDEHGGTAGLVTLEDLIETLVGDIYDESDDDEPSVVPLGDGKFRVDGSADLSMVMETIGVDMDIEDFDGRSVTGFIIHSLGNNPSENTVLELENVTIEVKELDGCSVLSSVFTVKDDKAPTEQ